MPRVALLAAVLLFAVPLPLRSQTAGDDPAAAREYFVERRTKTGIVSTSAYAAAVAQAAALQQYSTRANTAVGSSPNGATPQSLAWNWLGPANIGGRTRAVIVHPNFATNSVVYAAGADGGVWRSTVVGQFGIRQWVALDAGSMNNIAVNSLALLVDPAHPTDSTYDTLFAGTGEGYYNRDAVRGDGIYKWSRDPTTGTQSWSPLQNTQGRADFWYVNRIVINPQSSGAANAHVYAATGTGIFRSTDAGGNWVNVQGATLIGSGGFFDLAIRTDKGDTDYLFASEGNGLPLNPQTNAGGTWTGPGSGSGAKFGLKQEWD
jgi:hypothetical protein